MQITYDEARWLIEYDSDRALNSEKQRALTVEMNNVENILRDVMQKHWDHRPLPLLMDFIKIHTKNVNSLFAWRVLPWSHFYFCFGDSR